MEKYIQFNYMFLYSPKDFQIKKNQTQLMVLNCLRVNLKHPRKDKTLQQPYINEDND